MSIIIRGMEMPTGCYSKHESCPCLQSMGDRIWCGVTLKEITDGYNKRQPDCMLIELPPHGRLIDADATAEKILEYMRSPSNLANALYFINTIREMPAIIEVEEGKE